MPKSLHEHKWLVFEGSGGGDEQPPSKTGCVCSFSRVEVVEVVVGYGKTLQ